MLQATRLITLTFLAALTVTAPAVADSGGVHPVVFGGTGMLLGGSANGKWLSANEMASKLKGGEVYRHYGLNRALGQGKGQAPRLSDKHCPDTMLVDLSLPNGDPAMSVAGDWNAMPRVPRAQSTKQNAYREAVAAYLKDKGVAEPTVELTQVIRIDLEGDGVDEVLLTAQILPPRFGGARDLDALPANHSFVLMRKLHKGKVETLAVTRSKYSNPENGGDVPFASEIAAIVDVNGDGAMEIVVSNGFYEGYGATVITVDGLTVREVLFEGCEG